MMYTIPQASGMGFAYSGSVSTSSFPPKIKSSRPLPSTTKYQHRNVACDDVVMKRQLDSVFRRVNSGDDEGSAASSATLSAVLDSEQTFREHRDAIPQYITFVPKCFDGKSTSTAGGKQHKGSLPGIVACSFDRDEEEEDDDGLFSDDENSGDEEQEESGPHMMMRESFIDPEIDAEQGSADAILPLYHDDYSLGRISQLVRGERSMKLANAHPVALACAEIQCTDMDSDGSSLGVSQVSCNEEDEDEEGSVEEQGPQLISASCDVVGVENIRRSQQKSENVQAIMADGSRLGAATTTENSSPHEKVNVRQHRRKRSSSLFISLVKAIRPLFCALKASASIVKAHNTGAAAMRSSLLSINTPDNRDEKQSIGRIEKVKSRSSRDSSGNRRVDYR